MWANLHIQTVIDRQGLLALEDEWSRLVDAVGPGHPFLTHEWVRTWWDAFGGDKRLHVLAVRRGRECVGIAPLMIDRAQMYGLNVRRLGLIANEHTPRSDVLVAEPTVYRTLWRYLLDNRAAWDVMVLPQLEASSPTIEALSALADEQGVATGLWPAPDSPIVRLHGDYAGYLRGLTGKVRANLQRRRRRLEELGAVDLEIVRGGPDLNAALADGFRIEAAAWKAGHGTAIVSERAVRRFYSDLADIAAARGWLQLAFLTVGGKRIAFSYDLGYRNTLFLLKQGYDPDFAVRSPGSQLCLSIIRDCYARGVQAFDLLGTPEEWKQDWARSATSHAWLFVFAPTARSWLLYSIKFGLVPALRRARDEMQPALSFVRRRPQE